jgi:formylmethanofuran dehydrogenase subunit C
LVDARFKIGIVQRPKIQINQSLVTQAQIVERFRGVLTIGGNAGALVGERMRRGLVIVGGDAGDYAGGRMVAGTILLKRGVGANAGFGLRRGSLIFVEEPKSVLPTFGDCGVLEFDYLRLLEQWLRENGKAINLGGRARRLMGDMSVLGKGEMLILA